MNVMIIFSGGAAWDTLGELIRARDHDAMATSSPPSGCPMHSALPTPAPSASPPSGCPMHKARPAKVDEVNPVRASTVRIASLPAALPARAAQPISNAQAAPCGLLPGQRDADRAEPAARHGAACTAVHAPGQLKHPRALGRSYPSPNPNRTPTVALTMTVTVTVTAPQPQPQP